MPVDKMSFKNVRVKQNSDDPNKKILSVSHKIYEILFHIYL